MRIKINVSFMIDTFQAPKAIKTQVEANIYSMRSLPLPKNVKVRVGKAK